jgi:SAM-dependent methyltransferase
MPRERGPSCAGPATTRRERRARPGHLTFADSETAAARLALGAAIFAPATRAFLARVGGDRRSVLDLGCGPGHTTRLLAAACPHATVTGVDRSEAFLAAARSDGDTRLRFVAHDVTRAPLYVGPELRAAAAALGSAIRIDEVVVVRATTAAAATVFEPNLRTWRDDPWVKARYEAATLDALADGLAALRGASGDDAVRWTVRQVAVAAA